MDAVTSPPSSPPLDQHQGQLTLRTDSMSLGSNDSAGSLQGGGGGNNFGNNHDSGPTTASNDTKLCTERNDNNERRRAPCRRLSGESVVSTRSSVAEGFRSRITEPTVGLSPFLSACIVVNYISAGYVLLPYGAFLLCDMFLLLSGLRNAERRRTLLTTLLFSIIEAFAHGGTLLSCIVLLLTALQTYITATFILEACARAEALRNMVWIPQEPVQFLDTSEPEHRTRDRRMSASLPRNYSMSIRTHTYELSELSRIFLGERALAFFTLTSALDLYGLTWALAVIFGEAMTDHVHGRMSGSDKDYYFFMLMFVAITVPLACVPVIDQLWVQLIFLVARTVMVLFMICTVAVGYISSVPQFGSQLGPVKDVPLADFSNLMGLIQCSIFTTAFQFAVPTMAGVSLNKKSMLKVFNSSVTYIFITNLVIGVMLALFFGTERIEGSSNLNWLEYHGGTWDGNGSVEDGRAKWASAIANYIVFFAAIDGVAVFPLVAVSLGDILLGAFYREKAHEYRHDWKRRSLFRLLASIPQSIGALFVRDLGTIATYTGIFTLLSYTLCPSLLAIKSQKRMLELQLPSKTFYRTIFSSIYWAYGLCILSCLIIIGVIVDAIVDW